MQKLKNIFDKFILTEIFLFDNTYKIKFNTIIKQLYIFQEYQFDTNLKPTTIKNILNNYNLTHLIRSIHKC